MELPEEPLESLVPEELPVVVVPVPELGVVVVGLGVVAVGETVVAVEGAGLVGA